MLDTAAQVPPPILPVIALHAAAEAMVNADAPLTAERVADCDRVLAIALATRSTSTDEVGYRFALLRATLLHEGASDFAVALVDALAQDAALLASAGMGGRGA